MLIRLCRENGIPVFEKSFSLYDVYGADEAFVTGTFAGLAPVREVDGRQIRHPLERRRRHGAAPDRCRASFPSSTGRLCPPRRRGRCSDL